MFIIFGSFIFRHTRILKLMDQFYIFSWFEVFHEKISLD